MCHWTADLQGLFTRLGDERLLSRTYTLVRTLWSLGDSCWVFEDCVPALLPPRLLLVLQRRIGVSTKSRKTLAKKQQLDERRPSLAKMGLLQRVVKNEAMKKLVMLRNGSAILLTFW